MIETRLYTQLMATSALTTLIGDRFFPGIIPAGEERPGIAYQLLPGDGEEETHQGGTGLYFDEFQFTIQADSTYEAIQVQEVLETAMAVLPAKYTDYVIVRTHQTYKADDSQPANNLFLRRVRYEIEYKERS